jgi:hypothetical protein
MDEVNSALQFAQIAQGMGAEGTVAIKYGDMIDFLGDKLGVPAAVRNSAAERAFMLEQQQQQAAMQQAAMLQAQAAGAAPEGTAA